MSLSRLVRPIAIAAALIGCAASLGACSFSPVYGGSIMAQPSLNLAYAKPSGRLEQIIYQELALRFGSSDSPTAPLVNVSASTRTDDTFLSSQSGPNTLNDVIVTATMVITPRDGSGTERIRITRTATAQYNSAGQVLANNAAVTDARERAAKAVAESLRLAILASLSRQ